MTTSDRTAQPQIEDFDHLDVNAHPDQIRATFAAMRETCPVAHNERYGGFDLISRYADVRAALSDADTYSSADGVFVPPSGMPMIPALEFDDPEHARWRAVLEAPLTPRAVRALEPAITEVAEP